MASKAKADHTPREGAVLAKAVVRAADLLDVGSQELSVVVGLAETDLSKAREGDFAFESNESSFRSAIMFVRLFRSLDAIVGGNTGVARAWLRNENTVFESSPFEKIKNVAGLSEVVEYLDAKRAII